MPYIRVEVVFRVFYAKLSIRLQPFGILHIVNCKIHLPDEIYHKVMRMIPYNSICNTQYLKFVMKDEPKFSSESFHNNTVHSCSKEYDVPEWLIPYIMNLSNYSLEIFRNQRFGNIQNRIVVASSLTSGLFPNFHCYNHVMTKSNNSDTEYWEYFMHGGIDIAQIRMPKLTVGNG